MPGRVSLEGEGWRLGVGDGCGGGSGRFQMPTRGRQRREDLPTDPINSGPEKEAAGVRGFCLSTCEAEEGLLLSGDGELRV